MHFQKPEILVEVARDGSEKVGGNFVAEVFALIDGLTERVGMMRDVVHQPLQLRRAIGGAEVRFLQSRLRRNFAGRAIGNSPQSGDALSDGVRDRKSTRLNSSHSSISYAVFCLKKKKKQVFKIC